jgi:hypothetical protein
MRGLMSDERVTPSGWLPPVAPGNEPPRPRFEPRPPAPHVGPSPQAIWALVLAIAGLSLLLVSLGTLVILTLPCSIAAWVLAVRARASAPAESGQALAALWIARIGVLAGIAAAVVFIALLASGFDFEQLRDDVERELEERRDRGPNGNVRAARLFLGLG